MTENGYVVKTYDIDGDIETAAMAVGEALEGEGFRSVPSVSTEKEYRNPNIFFSSKRPLTCISRLRIDSTGATGKLRIGARFTVIRWFTITVMLFFCVVLPAVISWYQRGMIDIPPMAWLGVPLGFMVHYHVRARAFRALGRLVRAQAVSAGK